MSQRSVIIAVTRLEREIVARPKQIAIVLTRRHRAMSLPITIRPKRSPVTVAWSLANPSMSFCAFQAIRRCQPTERPDERR